MEQGTPAKSFTSLRTWKEAHKLALAIYRTTNLFPQSEQFALSNQLHRAGISITSNIAEGFSRNSSKDKNQFYRIALGSLTEAQNQLLLARDVGYLATEDFNVLAQHGDCE